MQTIILIYSFVIGAMIGSFLTAWIWRERHGRSMLEKHSVCPQCKHQLGPKDLVPIFSYLLQRGKCRYCQKRISPQYLLIELSTAVLFTFGATYLLESGIQNVESSYWGWICLLFLWAVIALLVALFVYDLKWYELPDIWTLGGSALAMVTIILAAILRQPLLWQPMHSSTFNIQGALYSILSGLLAALFFYAIVWGSEKILHKPGMGLGDVKLALLMGLFLGFPGIVIAIYLAFILGAVLSLILIAGKQKSWGQAVPFGPFLIAGTILSLWLTPMIGAWYLQFWP